MAARVLLVSGRAEIAEAFADDPGAELYYLERRPPQHVDENVAEEFQVVLIDLQGAADGVSLGKSLRARNKLLEWIVVADPEREREAVGALKVGAYDYLIWPFKENAEGWSLLSRALKKFVPAEPVKFPRPFGRYTLVKKLGEGGMAEIFLATLQQGGTRQLVIKRMHSNLASEEEFVKMFMDEARIAGQLVHPNVVKVHDCGWVGEHLYLTMDYVPGWNLEELRRKLNSHFPAPLACHLVAELCAGLHYAHTKPDRAGKPLEIVHRDINPPNVLISEEGRVVVTDFGIAKARTRYYETTAGTLKGKFEYMSPEQARGQPVDRRADIFSTGLILYELLAGVRPFYAPTPVETLFLIQQCQPVVPSSHNPELPPELDRIAMKTLARDPAARYQTAAQLEEELRSFARAHGNPGAAELARFARAVISGVPEPTPPPAEVTEPRLVIPRSAPVPAAAPTPAPAPRPMETVVEPTPLEPLAVIPRQPAPSVSVDVVGEIVRSVAGAPEKKEPRWNTATVGRPVVRPRPTPSSPPAPAAAQTDVTEAKRRLALSPTPIATVPGATPLEPLPLTPTSSLGSVIGLFPGSARQAERRRRILRVGVTGAALLALLVFLGPSLLRRLARPTPFPVALRPTPQVSVAPPLETETPVDLPAVTAPRPTPPPASAAIALRPPVPTAPVTPRVLVLSPPPTRPPPPSPPGSLSIWVDGWATVEIDGKSTAFTAPCRSIPLAPGRHVVTLTTGANLRKDFPVLIGSGRETKLSADFH